MAQCGSGNALPAFEIRRNRVSDVLKSVSPFQFHMAGRACRRERGACKIVSLISSSIPGVPHGKPTIK
jgi:hypothetical protein